MTLFPIRIRDLRTDREGLKQSDVAAAIGVSTQSYSTYENGREPSYETLVKLAKYFNCTTDYLLGVSNDKSVESIEKKNKDLQLISDVLELYKDSEGIASNIQRLLFSAAFLEASGGERDDMVNFKNTLGLFLALLSQILNFPAGYINQFEFVNDKININDFIEIRNYVAVSKEVADFVFDMLVESAKELMGMYAAEYADEKDVDTIRVLNNESVVKSNVGQQRYQDELRASLEKSETTAVRDIEKYIFDEETGLMLISREDLERFALQHPELIRKNQEDTPNEEKNKP